MRLIVRRCAPLCSLLLRAGPAGLDTLLQLHQEGVAAHATQVCVRVCAYTRPPHLGVPLTPPPPLPLAHACCSDHVRTYTGA